MTGGGRRAAPAAGPQISEPGDEANADTERPIAPAPERRPIPRRNNSAIQPMRARRGGAIQSNEPDAPKPQWPEAPEPPPPERINTAKLETCALEVQTTLWTDGPRWRVIITRDGKQIDKSEWKPRERFFGDLALKMRDWNKFLLRGFGRPVVSR